MIPPQIGFSAALLVAGLVCLLGGLIVSQTRYNALGSIPLIVLMFSFSWWDITYGLFWAKAPAPYPNFWLYLTYLGVVIIPPAALIFAMQISELDEWVKPPLLIGLSIVPILTIALMATDAQHNLFFGGHSTENIGMIINAGPVYWANTIYSYLLILVSMIIFVRRFRQSAGIYRTQLGIILFGLGFPWLNSFIFLAGLSPFSNADNTPFSFTITGLAFTYALLRYRLLDILPIARSMLIENMSDGVVVLDAQDRLVDFNSAAAHTLKLAQPPQIGYPARDFFSAWSELIQTLSKPDDLRAEIFLDQPAQVFLDLKISRLQDRRNNLLGRLIVWRDITPLKLAEAELREQVIRDPLTGLYNRRYLDEALERELANAARLNRPLSLVMIDIDHFKQINDRLGHTEGDTILRSFAKLLIRHSRVEDTLYRYGGEEFLALLPNSSRADTLKVAEKWRGAFQELHAMHHQEAIHATISCGVAEFPTQGQTGAELIARADQALYQAKNAGRNRVVAWKDILKHGS
ncbi:MAG: diguanylate cyclase [Anaerolineales bacterium]|nr:diguanylate cyclase [Anaerolineales bacterium]